ncbi:MAG: hypothetical protein IPH80_32045 [Myxococcales bacterium]|nr:hypothetical protein [Myxococcales bacterium]
MRAGADELAYDLAALDLADGSLTPRAPGSARSRGAAAEAADRRPASSPIARATAPARSSSGARPRRPAPARACSTSGSPPRSASSAEVADEARRDRGAGGGAGRRAAPRDAAPVTVGVFAPSTPFDGTAGAARVRQQARRPPGRRRRRGSGLRQGQRLRAALAKGDVQLAVVDASFLAASGAAHTDLAVAIRDGATAVAWQLVARAPTASVLELRGKTVLAPITDGRRHAAFVDNALLGGELAAGFWKIEPSPDALSAVAAVAFRQGRRRGGAERRRAAGRRDRVATLPSGELAGVDQPGRARPPSCGARRASARPASAAAARSPASRASGVDGLRKGLARRMKKALRQALIVPNLRITVGELVMKARSASSRRWSPALLRAAVTIACAGRPRGARCPGDARPSRDRCRRPGAGPPRPARAGCRSAPGCCRAGRRHRERGGEPAAVRRNRPARASAATAPRSRGGRRTSRRAASEGRAAERWQAQEVAARASRSPTAAVNASRHAAR